MYHNYFHPSILVGSHMPILKFMSTVLLAMAGKNIFRLSTFKHLFAKVARDFDGAIENEYG